MVESGVLQRADVGIGAWTFRPTASTAVLAMSGVSIPLNALRGSARRPAPLRTTMAVMGNASHGVVAPTGIIMEVTECVCPRTSAAPAIETAVTELAIPLGLVLLAIIMEVMVAALQSGPALKAMSSRRQGTALCHGSFER